MNGSDKKKFSISIEEIMELEKRMRQINNYDLSDLEFTRNGIPIQTNPLVVDHFKYTRLSNMDFIVSGFYKKGFEDYEEL